MPPRKKAETKPVESQLPVVFGSEKLAFTSLVKLLHRKGVLDKDEFDRVINELG